MQSVKLVFDRDQAYQLNAVQSVIDLFDGQPLVKGGLEISFSDRDTSVLLTDKGVGNNLILSEEQLFDNMQKVQKRNKISTPKEQDITSWTDEDGTDYWISSKLATISHESEEDGDLKKYAYPNYTIEMETGTGKTYTYLRTIYELNRIYGFSKFVIVVPSIAIREGVITTLRITHDHFQEIYNNPPQNYTMYDRLNLTSLRNFATSTAIQILVINIDSFTRDSNVINTIRETGTKPIEFIQLTKPIVIVDEPQNFETPIRQQAISNLHPSFTIRYSATHRNLYNLVYSLNPVQAYDLGLVKHIEVDGVTSDDDYNSAFIRVKSIIRGKRKLKANITIYSSRQHSVVPTDTTVEIGDDIYEKSNWRDMYKNGYVINSINSENESIEFANGLTMHVGETQGGLTDEVMKFQIERAVKWHFEKVEKLKAFNIKVLSLVFIDRVANYRIYDEGGNPVKGKYALWIEDSINKYKAIHPGLIPYDVETLHNGYFSSDKSGKGKAKIEFWTDTEGTTLKDNDTYALIMQDKERLLSTDEPLQFIFTHSALREGWDNPNVFQICTLNESRSELKKRQEIGRGLRLPVNAEGKRVFDKAVNILTVVANESYEDFSKALQQEIQDETSVDFTGRINNAREKGKVKLTKQLTPENCPLFFDIWQRINKKTSYSVELKTDELISLSVEAIKKMPVTQQPIIQSRTASLNVTTAGIVDNLKAITIKRSQPIQYLVPNVYKYIQNKLDITRKTIHRILIESDRYVELTINPQMYLDNVIACIKSVLNKLLVDGVKYKIINDTCYEITLFKNDEIETYLSRLFSVTHSDKTLYNYIQCDSDIEKTFAGDCEKDDCVKFFFKLPRSFKVSTPIGDYTPDWAVVFEYDTRIYFIAETKGTLNKQLLREVEQMKIACGEKHFAQFKTEGVEYRLATSITDLH